WSDSANPSTAWTLRDGTAALPHVASWQSQMGGWSVAQPGWAVSENGTDRIPFWFKSNGSETFDHSWGAGDVVVHSQDDGNGIGNGPANVVWTAPSAGVATVSGGVWWGRNIGRANHWTLLVNQAAVSDGQIDGGGPYSQATPFLLAAGSGGAGAV